MRKEDLKEEYKNFGTLNDLFEMDEIIAFVSENWSEFLNFMLEKGYNDAEEVDIWSDEFEDWTAEAQKEF